MFYKICSDISKVAPLINTFHNSCRFYRTHYEVLNLPRNCTTKEIRSAFIKLSKEYHPDVNKSHKSHARFLQINEAYKVLGKSETRHNYDLGLRLTNDQNIQSQNRTEAYYEQPREQRGWNPQHDPSFWVNRNKYDDRFYKDKSYYGIDGVPRLPHGYILVCCIILSCVSLALQYMAITNSVTFKRDTLIKKSLEAEKALDATREAATVNGNVVQLEALRTKLLGNQIKQTDDK